MAEVKFIQTETPTDNEPIFKAFQWHGGRVREHDTTIPGAVYAALADAARDVGSGVNAVLALLEQDMITEGDGQRMLSVPVSGELLRLAMCSTRMLADKAERGMEGVVFVVRTEALTDFIQSTQVEQISKMTPEEWRAHATAVLAKNNGNQTHAAKELGISRARVGQLVNNPEKADRKPLAFTAQDPFGIARKAAPNKNSKG